MHRQEDHMVLLFEPDQWSVVQIEWLLFLSTYQLGDSPVAVFQRQMRQIFHPQRQIIRRIDHLYRLVIKDRERGPYRFVATNNLVQAPLHSSYVERLSEPESDRHIVDSGSRNELIQEP